MLCSYFGTVAVSCVTSHTVEHAFGAREARGTRLAGDGTSTTWRVVLRHGLQARTTVSEVYATHQLAEDGWISLT